MGVKTKNPLRRLVTKREVVGIKEEVKTRKITGLLGLAGLVTKK